MLPYFETKTKRLNTGRRGEEGLGAYSVDMGNEFFQYVLSIFKYTNERR